MPVLVLLRDALLQSLLLLVRFLLELLRLRATGLELLPNTLVVQVLDEVLLFFRDLRVDALVLRVELGRLRLEVLDRLFRKRRQAVGVGVGLRRRLGVLAHARLSRVDGNLERLLVHLLLAERAARRAREHLLLRLLELVNLPAELKRVRGERVLVVLLGGVGPRGPERGRRVRVTFALRLLVVLLFELLRLRGVLLELLRFRLGDVGELRHAHLAHPPREFLALRVDLRARPFLFALDVDPLCLELFDFLFRRQAVRLGVVLRRRLGVLALAGLGRRHSHLERLLVHLCVAVVLLARLLHLLQPLLELVSVHGNLDELVHPVRLRLGRRRLFLVALLLAEAAERAHVRLRAGILVVGLVVGRLLLRFLDRARLLALDDAQPLLEARERGDVRLLGIGVVDARAVDGGGQGILGRLLLRLDPRGVHDGRPSFFRVSLLSGRLGASQRLSILRFLVGVVLVLVRGDARLERGDLLRRRALLPRRDARLATFRRGEGVRLLVGGFLVGGVGGFRGGDEVGGGVLRRGGALRGVALEQARVDRLEHRGLRVDLVVRLGERRRGRSAGGFSLVAQLGEAILPPREALLFDSVLAADAATLRDAPRAVVGVLVATRGDALLLANLGAGGLGGVAGEFAVDVVLEFPLLERLLRLPPLLVGDTPSEVVRGLLIVRVRAQVREARDAQASADLLLVAARGDARVFEVGVEIAVASALAARLREAAIDHVPEVFAGAKASERRAGGARPRRASPTRRRVGGALAEGRGRGRADARDGRGAGAPHDGQRPEGAGDDRTRRPRRLAPVGDERRVLRARGGGSHQGFPLGRAPDGAAVEETTGHDGAFERRGTRRDKIRRNVGEPSNRIAREGVIPADRARACG